jgi:hypothetical protein
VRVKHCSAILQACVAFVPFACIPAYVQFRLPELLKRVKISLGTIFHAISLFVLCLPNSLYFLNTRVTPNYLEILHDLSLL